MTWTREQLLRALIEQAPGYVTLVEGPELLMTYASEATAALLGVPLVGRSVREVFAGTRVLEIAERVYATGQPETVKETPLLHAGGDPTRYFTRTYTPLKDPDGTVQGLYVVAHEVTADVHGRQAFEASEQQRRAELDRMFALFDEAPVMIAVLTPPGWTIALANRGIRTLLGDRVPVGSTLRSLVSADNRTMTALDRVYSTGRAETYEQASQLLGYADRTFSISLVPVRSADGAIDGVMAAAVEVTEQRRARQDLEAQARDLDRAREEAVAATRAKDQFLAMLGHELRNPLQPMLSAVQMMRFDGESSLALDMLEQEVRYLTRLVDDLLDISRVSRGMVILEVEPLDLRSAISRGLELASPILEQRGHRVTTKFETHALGVSGDPQRLAQVVSNLLQNAAKYSAPGSAIRIVGRRANDRIVFEISDEGVGIAPDMLDRMFGPFVQGEQPLDRSRGGLGIGLAIVQNLVEAHNGSVTARSRGLGHGSTFVVELPALDIAPSAYEGHDSGRVRRPMQSPNPVHILIVDDNVDATETLRMGLDRFGHRISVAFDGPSALDLIKRETPQIALLDIGLPLMDGYQLGKLLRKSLDIPMVAITGYGQSVDRERSVAAGFAAHLVKPVDLTELAALVDKLAGAR